MKIHEGYENLNLKNPVVTLGIFDGVHRGHRTLLGKLVSRAASAGGESVVITFDPHPKLVIDRKNTHLFFLSTMNEKIRLLEKAHIEHLVVIHFTESFSRIRACDFVRTILAEKIGTRHLIIGHDHHFGYRGEGDFETINDCAKSSGFEVEQVKGLKSREGVISSSIIREALSAGNLDNANKWLGYSYSLGGRVIEGKRIGRKLGFPTANLKPDAHKLVPASGVYAVDVRLKNTIQPGMLSIGTNPTINKAGSKTSIEVHIFDFEDNIYDEEIEVVFRYRLRNEIRFDTVDDLSLQMVKDREIALRLLT